MTINKGTIAITIATLALVISCYGTFFKDQPSSPNKPKQQLSPTVSISTPAEYQQSNEALIDELSKKVSSLQRKVANLTLHANGSYQEQNTDEFKELVLGVLEEKQQQEDEKRREQNPLYSFYADLPEDYDLRIKSEPDYAKQIEDVLAQFKDELDIPEENIAEEIFELLLDMALIVPYQQLVPHDYNHR